MSGVSEAVDDSTTTVTNRLSRDELFDVLANQRRRCVLEFFLRNETDATVERLVEYIAGWENDKPVSNVTDAERKRVRTALRQNHLPKMEQAGLIEHHEATDTIELTDAFTDLNVYLQVVGRRMPYSVIYLGLSILCVTLFTLSWAGIGISEMLGMAVTVTLFGITALVHLYYTRHSELGAHFLSEIEK